MPVLDRLKTRLLIAYLKRKIRWLFRDTPWNRQMHCQFEPALKLDCVKNLIDIVRSGEVGNGEIAEAIQHASCFAGCAAQLYLSSRPDVAAVGHGVGSVRSVGLSRAFSGRFHSNRGIDKRARFNFNR